MSGSTALRTAVELVHMPTRARLLRREPLPDGVVDLLRIAAGEDDAIRSASTALERPADVVRQAAEFFIEQVLLAPESDSYRVLGADPTAPSAELRRNLGLLLKWLHPDLERGAEHALYVNRVTQAWDDLKTQDKRTSYDERTDAARVRMVPQRGDAPRDRSGSYPKVRKLGLHKSVAVRSAQLLHMRPGTGLGFFRRALGLLFGSNNSSGQ